MRKPYSGRTDPSTCAGYVFLFCYSVEKEYVAYVQGQSMWGGGGACGGPRRQNEYFKEKLYFLHLTNLKLLSETERNLINKCDFFFLSL
jgi:hypothetical protein